MRKSLGKVYRKFLPLRVQVFLDCKRAEKSWTKEGAIFVHVPKSAGMSISSAIYGQPLGHIKARDIKRCSKSAYDSCFKFAFLRDPLARYLSSWKFMQDNYAVLKGGPGLPSEHFLSLGPIEFAEKWLVGKNLSTLNFIFQDQSSFILDDQGKVLVDYIANFDDFDHEISILSMDVPKIKSIDRVNASGSESLKVDDDKLENVLKEIYSQDYDLLKRFL